MDKHFYPERGKDAWPGGCPSCGEPVTAFAAETGDESAWWEFGCGCSFYFDSIVGLPVCGDDCPDAMNQHTEGLVIHTGDEA